MKCVERQRDQFKVELIEALEEIMANVGQVETDAMTPGPHTGWTFSMASSAVMAAGERLVELGTWEAHPDNAAGSRIQWYRKKPNASQPVAPMAAVN